jgi:D-alanyl-D-alanine carboxypeptidase/D-alanyl-D-alanine-endopeptidase (penicillin-binding protein 4)
MHHRSIILPLIALSVVAAPLSAGPLEDAPAKIDAWVVAHERAQSRAVVGVCIVDLATGSRVYERNAETVFKPASNQKLLTAAFALERLGKNFHFTTAVCQLGDDLILTGEADPLLGDPLLAKEQKRGIYADLDRWAAAVRELAGTEIKGRLLLRTQVAPNDFHPADWTATDRSRHYGPPVADLNFHNNCYDVTFTRDEATKAILPMVAPASRFITVRNLLQPGSKHVWRLAPDSTDSVVTLTGTVTGVSNVPLSAPCKNPPLLLGRVFRDRLKRAGVNIAGGVATASADQIDMSEAKLLAGTRTPLAAVLARANKRSLNLAAECLLLRAGDGTWAGSAKLMRQTLIERFGLSETLVVRDGSGLSHANRVSPGDLAALLTRLAARDDFDIYLASLARSGTDGTLRSRLKSDAHRGRLAAKTGYVAGARSLSGYVLDADAAPKLAFSIIVNGTTAGASDLVYQVSAALIDAVD